MATTQTSPWAGVPYAADVTQADVQPPPAVWAAPAPDLPAPTMPTVTQKPRLDPHAGLPQVFAPVDPQEQIAEHLQGELQNDYHKDADPYGSPDNHPGFLGKLAHALSHATGGDTRRQWEEQGLAKQINDVRGEQFTNADRGETAAHLNEDTAEMPQKAEDTHNTATATERHLNDESNNLEHPAPEYEIHDTQAGPLFVNKKTGAAQHLSVDGTPIGPKIQTEVKQIEVRGKPHQILINSQDGTPIKDLGESGEKPPSMSVSTGTWSLGEDPTTGKPEMFNNKTGAIKDAPAGMAKQGTFEKGNEKVSNIVNAAAMAHQLQTEAEKGNAEADPALALLYFKAIKGPDGTGIRFTQTEQNLILGARNSAGDLEQIGQKVAGGGQKFTPEQRRNVVRVVDMYAQAAQRQHAGGDVQGSQPIVQQSPSTGQFRYSTDGGKTWQAGKPKGQ